MSTEQILVKGKLRFVPISQLKITNVIIHMKKLLDSDWLRAVQFKCKPVQKV